METHTQTSRGNCIALHFSLVARWHTLVMATAWHKNGITSLHTMQSKCQHKMPYNKHMCIMHKHLPSRLQLHMAPNCKAHSWRQTACLDIIQDILL